MSSNCGLCHQCGTEMENEKCPTCGNAQGARDHQNLGVTSCQFANFMRQQTLIGGLLNDIVEALKPKRDITPYPYEKGS